MPLIILGLIVILGGCLLIYYQLGPKVTLRLKSGFGLGGAGGADAGGADGAQGAQAGQEAPESAGGAAGASGPGGPGAKAETEEGEKVLYVFGDGEREERPLRGPSVEVPGEGGKVGGSQDE